MLRYAFATIGNDASLRIVDGKEFFSQTFHPSRVDGSDLKLARLINCWDRAIERLLETMTSTTEKVDEGLPSRIEIAGVTEVNEARSLVEEYNAEIVQRNERMKVHFGDQSESFEEILAA